MAAPRQKSSDQTATISLTGDEILVSFPYSKQRFASIKRLGRASYDKEIKKWRLPLDLLPRLERSKHFKPSTLRYTFEREEVAERLEERSQDITTARKRVAANPFQVSEEDIALADVEVAFRLHEKSQTLHATLRNRSPLRKHLEQLPGTQYIRNERSYYFPVHRLNSFLRFLRDQELSFAVEQSIGKRLAQTAEIRLQACKGERYLDPEALQNALLVPYVAIHEDGQHFSLEHANAEQLRHCFPEVADYRARRKLAKRLNERELLAALYSASNSETKVWLSDAVWQFIESRRAQYLEHIESTPLGFEDSLLCFAQPPACWIVEGSSRAGLLLEREELARLDASASELLTKTPKELSTHFPGHYLFAPANSELPGFYEALSLTDIPHSKHFCLLHREIKRRAALVARRDHYQAMQDSKLGLSNEELEGKLFPHQRVAVSWLQQTPRAFLGDDMGLGKTLSVLTYFDELSQAEELDFLLVVCPTSLARNWLREAIHWVPRLNLSLLPETKAKREKFLQQLSSQRSHFLDGIIVNYEAFRLEYVYPHFVELLREKKALLCLDESQRVKNAASKTFKALKAVAPNCERRVLLSGTPTPKDITDIWAQANLLDDGERFGNNYYEWLPTIAKLGNKWSEFAIQEFYPEAVRETILRMHELLLRRRKENVVDLPEKLFSIRDVPLRGDQQKRYEEVRKELFVRVSATNGDSYYREIDNILEEYLRAVQTASNPRLVDPGWEGEPAKFLELDELVREIVEQREEKLVIWTNYRGNVSELVERYKHLNAAPFSGDVDTNERAKTIESFQSQDKASTKILVAIPAAGGVGITLTAAQTAIYLDKTWNAEHWLQSIDRIHRIGQNGTVSVISLHACKVDEIISGNLRKKERAQAKLLGDGENAFNDLLPTREELLAALSKEKA